MNDSAAIGVFDSGIGGLSVLKSLVHKMPDENFIYLGDTARLPYGNKSPRTIASYVQQNIQYFSSLNIKALVIACNSASSSVVSGGLLENESFPFPVFNVIEPAARLAVEQSESKKIGVLGTRATISSQVYVEAIHQNSQACEVFQQACPLFVPLVEEGWTEDPLTNLVTFRYLQPVLASNIDTLILGCTHYPFLKAAIQKVVGPEITLIDSADAVAETVSKKLGLDNTDPKNTGSFKLLTTDKHDVFQHLAQSLLGVRQTIDIDQIDL